MKKLIKNLITVLVFIAVVPPTILFGFFLSQQFEIYLRTPRYEVYNLPLRTTFFLGCEIYSSYEIRDNDQLVIGYDTSWHSCDSYKKYIKYKYLYDTLGNSNSN